MKRYITLFILILFAFISLLLAKTFMDILHYRNTKVLTIQKISDKPFWMAIPVSFCSTRKRGPYIPVWTNDGQYGMFFDTKSNRLFFYAGKSAAFGIVHVTYEIIDPDSKQKLFEIYQTQVEPH